MSWAVTADVEEFPEAAEFFRSRFPITAALADRLGAYAGPRAWTVAGVAQLDVVLTVWESLLRAIEIGKPFDEETLFAAGLSANGNATRSGDEMGLLQLVVIVSDEPRPGDANCDGWLSAADLTEIAHLTAVGKTEECALADANCDGAVDAADIAVVIASLFDSPAATECEEAGGAQ